MSEQEQPIGVTMLRAALDGISYDTLAAQHNITPSAVWQRVRRAAIDLQQVVGVVGVSEDTAPTLSTMRKHREEFLEALSHYVPDRALRAKRRRATCFSIEQFNHLEAAVKANSPAPEMDLALLLVLFATGLKPIEVSRLSIADVIDKDGALLEQSTVRPQVAFNGHRRPLFLGNARLQEALQGYLDRTGSAADRALPFRGLDPARLLFDRITIKPASDSVAPRRDGILHAYRRILQYGPVEATALSARRRITRLLRSRRIPQREIALVLGLAGAGDTGQTGCAKLAEMAEIMKETL